MLTQKKFIFILSWYSAISIGVLIAAPFFGSENLSWNNVSGSILSGQTNVDSDIFFSLRLPRVITSFIVGGILSVAGSALQVVLRNPLAEPFILGIAGSGAVGAVIAISIPGLLIHLGAFSSVQFLSLTGSMLCVLIIYWLAVNKPDFSMTNILLSGVTINIFCGAMILLVRYMADPGHLVAMDRWMMGGLDVVGYGEVFTLLPLVLPGLILLFLKCNTLNQLAFGEEMATGHGVNVASVQRHVFLGSGLATAGAVSIAGPIGFVGLIIPHAVRRISGVDNRVVLPSSFLLGGAFLTVCDLVARTIVAPTEMPVGIITAIVGGPLFLRILLKGESMRGE